MQNDLATRRREVPFPHWYRHVGFESSTLPPESNWEAQNRKARPAIASQTIQNFQKKNVNKTTDL